MSEDDIIRMAREAGLLTIGTADGSEAVYTWPKGITEELGRFAALVAAAEQDTAPPQKEWVGLSDEEIGRIEIGLRIPNCYRDTYDLSLTEFAKAVEAKLKEKNT